MNRITSLPDRALNAADTRKDSSPIYKIVIQGHLEPSWSEWFNDMAIGYTQEGDTLLTGPISDQAALHGLLARVRDLGLVLVSLNRVTDTG